MTPEEQQALWKAYNEWADYWLAKNGEPELKTPPDTGHQGTEGDGAYNCYALLVDASSEMLEDLRQRQEKALADVQRP